MAETKKVPIAGAKAAALTSYLAMGGPTVTKTRRGYKGAGARYASGPMKGLTIEQATQKFEGLWSKTHGSVKDKYANQVSPGNALAPSEKAEYDQWKREKAEKEKAGTGSNSRPGTTTKSDQSPASNGPGKPVSAGFAPGSDEARAAALTENSANEKLATATVGNFMDMRSAVAAERGDPDLMGVNKDIADRDQALANDQAKKDDAAEVARVRAKQNEARSKAGLPPSPTAGQPPSPATPLPGGYRPIGSRAEDIAAAGNDPTKLPTDSRMVVQDKVNGGSTPVVKAPPGPREGKAMPAIAPSVSALREAPDFTPGPDKELTGMSGGRPTYTSADSLYGKAKPSISNTIKNTPATADPKKPVMIEGQTIEQRRADYQTRQNNTPGQNDAANNALRGMGITPTRESAKTPIPRGPASQPEPKYQSPIAKGGAFSDEAYASTRAAQERGVAYEAEQAKKPTMDDVNRSFKPGTPEHTAAAWGVNAKTGEQLTKEDTKNTAPTSSRVVSTRDATAQESKDGKAREIPAIQPTPEPSAKPKPKFARR